MPNRVRCQRGGITMAQETKFGGADGPAANPRGRLEIESDPSLEDEEPFPLFLYSHDEPQPAVFEKPSGEGMFSSRAFRLGLLMAFAAAAVVAILALVRLFTIISSEKTSQAGAAAAPPSLVLVNNSPIGTAASLPDASSAPSREYIAAAFDSVRQSQTEIRQPGATPPPPRQPAPPRQMDPAEIATMMKRARSLIAIGDIAAARLLLERAADAQEPSAALLLAQTYDPAVLGTADARSITPDPVAARNWYRKAAQLGSQDAQQRLAQMKD
jgi:hypothetical protein